MSDLTTIGASAIGVYQRALATTGNNIANLNTEGYSRQEVVIAPGTTREVGGLSFGTGAKLEAVKRLFDGFAELSLRNSIANLNTQAPLVDFSTRMVDLLGDRVAGLSPAMDQFFAGALELAQDPASRILRDRFLRGAEDLAARFGEISDQIDAFEEETRGAITRGVETLTILGRQLAGINQELGRRVSIGRQPPELLDRRDLVLRQMSEIAQVHVAEAANGVVSVSLTESSSQGAIVEGIVAREVGVAFDERNPAKVDLIVDPRGSATVISGVRSGTLGGLATFREQVLQPTLDAIDSLALAMAREVNAAHRGGVDFLGNVGKDLFAVDPVFSVVSPAQRLNVAVDVQVEDPAAVRFRDVSFTYDARRRLWVAEDGVSGERFVSGAVVAGQARVQVNGLSVTIVGQPVDAESFVLEAANRPATGLRLAIDDPFEVAAADLFRAVRGDGNLGSAQASVAYDPLDAAGGLAPPLDRVLSNNGLASIAVAPRAIGATPDALRSSLIATVPAGYRDVSLLLGGIADAGDDLQIQVFTRDGRHLLGSNDPPPSELLASPATAADLGFEAGATYSDQYLNRSDLGRYKDVSAFYGVQAAPVVTGEFGAIDPELPATGSRLLPAGALVVNGRALGPLDVPEGAAALEASDVARWFNEQAVPGVSARAVNLLRLAPGQLDPSLPLVMNGVSIELAGASGASAQVSAINARSAESGVGARLNLDGSIDIEAIDGGNIDLEPEANALGIRGDRVLAGSLRLESLDHVDLRFGREGAVAGEALEVSTAETLRRLGIAVEPAVIASDTIPAVAAADGQPVVAAGAIAVNGVAMDSALAPSAGNELQAFDVAAWFEAAGLQGVQARATTTAEFDPASLALAFPLSIGVAGGAQVEIPEAAGAGWRDLPQLVSAINSRFEQTGVSARIARSGKLVLEQAEGRTIVIGAAGAGGNALGLSGETRLRGRFELASSDGPLRVGFGEGGAPKDLARLGLRAGAYIEGAASEDLLVFVTGSGSGTLSAEYTAGEIDPVAALRDGPLDIRFSSETAYTIVDVNSGTVVAERAFNFGNDQTIAYRGLAVTLSARPQAGDRFRIDGNQDGIGNNANIRRLADLQNAAQAGGLTFAQNYQQTVSVVGNQARQAGLARDALEVVNEQAIAARDRVSGVNLDEEAANLVRFQQAFQAAARVIQTANQLFDTLLQIR